MTLHGHDESWHDTKCRLRAEATNRLNGARPLDEAGRPVEEILHELQVHQIELEMQNEELRRAQLALEESRDRYLDLYEFAPVGYITLSPTGIVANANLTGAALLGVERLKLLHHRFAPCVSPHDRDRWHALLIDVVKHREPKRADVDILRPDGTVAHVRLDCLYLSTENEVPTVRVAITDITEQQEAEIALRDADRRKDEFLAMLAHELRNPLAPIRNAAHVIGRLGLDEPKIQWAQEVIETQVTHLTRMVDDLLDISRIVRGKITLKRENIAFAALAQQVAASARLLAESKGQQLAVHLPEQPLWLEGDPVRLSQVLLNLLDNAVKYTPEGGRIEFDAHLAGPEIEIAIRDNGSGIRAALLPRVFDLFQQDERNLDRAAMGLGVGLTLVHRLVGMHGGRVTARSAGQDQGATFTVWLPANIGAEPLAAPAAPEAPGSPAGIRVLVVDDDHAVADSTAVLLELEGYEARIALTGLDALEQVRQYRPQLVLLDIGLKGMDGFETAQRLREMPEGRNLHLIAVTGYGDTETRERALESGCDHFVIKPMAWDALGKLLTETVGKGLPATSQMQGNYPMG